MHTLKIAIVMSTLGIGLAVFAADYFADANRGNDEWDGSCPYEERDEDAFRGPKKTLAAVALLANENKGGVIHAASGIYCEGEMYSGFTDAYVTNRVAIASGVVLLGESAETTVIEGHLSSQTPEGNGLDAVRCVYAKSGSVVKNFTIRNGATKVAVNNAKNGGGGCFGDGLFVDCVISNCASYAESACYGSLIDRGTFLRCSITAGRNGNYVGYGTVRLVDCVVDGTCYMNVGGNSAVNTRFVRGAMQSGSKGRASMYNCIVVGEGLGYCDAYCCRFGKGLGSSTDADQRNEVDADGVLCDGNLRPVPGSSCIDSGNYDYYVSVTNGWCELWLEEWEELDFFRGVRVLAGDLDIGPGEYGNHEAWHVDPIGGNDGNSGRAGQRPKKTLAAIMRLVSSGDVVHAVPGVYSEGGVSASSDNTACRVVVPAGVTLVADGGAGVTFIDGKQTVQEGKIMLGSENLRCVQLSAGSIIRGFTLRNGGTNKSSNYADNGGGVYGGKKIGGAAIDCVVSNCYAVRGGGAAYVNLIRCHVLDCAYTGECVDGTIAANPAFSGAYSCNVYNSVVEGTVGSAGRYEMRNSTITDGVSSSNVLSPIYNSYIGADSGKIALTNSIVASTYRASTSESDVSTRYGVTVGFSPSFVPTRRNAATVGKGNAQYYALPDEYALEAGLDYNRIPRFTDGRLDVGAAQWVSRQAGFMLIFR